MKNKTLNVPKGKYANICKNCKHRVRGGTSKNLCRRVPIDTSKTLLQVCKHWAPRPTAKEEVKKQYNKWLREKARS